MKIAYIAAGAAGMYCGSCLHDNTLAQALLKRGQDVVLTPTYTPLRTDTKDVSIPRVFMGGVNAYLMQASPLLRMMPGWMMGMLDKPSFLDRVTRGAGSVDPAKLGGMTVSMLRGEQGNQARLLHQLVDWLLEEVQPDVVHLSNAMLLGMAREINRRCGPPVVCALSGEDIFLEALQPPHYEQARALLRERAAEVAGFTALNAYYADFMSDYLAVDRASIHVIPHGLHLDDYPAPSDGSSEQPPRKRPPTVGFLARVCRDKGLHLLVEACQQVAEQQPDLDFRVQAAGYLGQADRAYLKALTETHTQGPLAGRFEYLGELSREGKLGFLHSLDLFCTPTLYRESKGLPAIEALAAGVPVVLPNHGSFPELIEKTGGGVLFPPGDAAPLAAQLARLLGNPELARSLGETGRRAVWDYYHADRMAEDTMALYTRLME